MQKQPEQQDTLHIDYMGSAPLSLVNARPDQTRTTMKPIFHASLELTGAELGAMDIWTNLTLLNELKPL